MNTAHTQGMDVAQVQHLARDLSEVASEVKRIKAELSQEVQDLEWWGDDAAQFRASWESEVGSAFDTVNSLLMELSETAARNAKAQEQTSGR